MTPPGIPVYALAGIKHRYGRRIVLDLPALEVARGETLGVIGPSGAGKSTLLRLLQLIERPTEGTIRVDGTDVALPARAEQIRRITTVFQRPIMLDRTVRDNVAFGLRIRGRRDDELVERLLERISLSRLAGAPARSLSGGEVQRVALARAVATGSDVLLLDEPAANLDPGNVALVESLIREQQEAGRTIVLVTHNTHEARRLADRTLLLLEGRPVEVGPTAGLFEAPQDSRTRGFLAGELIY
ncbi:MAG: ATP-binding cassette domain-containing protein [Acidobacteriota bacterium]